MKTLLLTAKLTLVTLPFIVATNSYAASDLPPPRAVSQTPVDDLPPPRTTTRKPRALPAESPASAAQSQANTTDDLPPPSWRSRKPVARGFQPVLKMGVDDFLLETAALPDAVEADTYSTLRTSAYVLWQPSSSWEFRAGARLDGMTQDGGRANHRELIVAAF